jgi:excisionase family DNA binding protein
VPTASHGGANVVSITNAIADGESNKIGDWKLLISARLSRPTSADDNGRIEGVPTLFSHSIMTLRELAEYLQVDPSIINRLVSTGRIPALRMSGACVDLIVVRSTHGE